MIGASGPSELDHGVVDLERGQGGHQVFDGGDGDAGVVGDHGAKAGLGDGLGGHRHAVVAVKVGADEDDAGAGRGGTYGHPHALAGMQATPAQMAGPASVC